MSEFDVNWPHGHQTRDGRPALVIRRNGRSGASSPMIIALICDKKATEWPVVCDATGKLLGSFGGHLSDISHLSDIINKPAPLPARWVNVYRDGIGRVYRSKHDAHERGKGIAIACRAFTCRDGEIVDVTDEQEAQPC